MVSCNRLIKLNKAEHLLSFVEDILDLPLAESKHIDAKLSTVSIVNLLDAVTMMITLLANHNGICIINHSKCSESVTIEVDEKITQIMLNLASNAIKYNVYRGIIIGACETLRDKSQDLCF